MANDTKERLAQRRAQEHAQTLEAQMAARGAAIDEIGQKLGEPVDFSRGIPFAEDGSMAPPPAPKTGTSKAPIRPDVVIPKPPSQTRAEEAQLSQEEAEEEQRQYELAMRAAGIPRTEVNPADYRSNKKPLPKRDTKHVAHKKPPHPLLVQLRGEFGVGSDQKKPIDVRVADHVWTFVPLSPDLIALAARAADTLSETLGEHALRAKQAAVCFAIVAVDSVPVWLMLGIEPGEHDDVSFPLLPKGPIRRNAAVSLYSELTDGLSNQLLEALYEAYVAKVDKTGQVASYMSYEKVDHVVWVCSEPDCDHKLTKPRHYNANNEELPYFCEVHGVEMLDISTTKPRIDEDLRPLG